MLWCLPDSPPDFLDRGFNDFFATLPIVAKKCCKDFEKMENVAKSMLQGFWHFLKCCKAHVAKISKMFATFISQMLQKKKTYASGG